MAFPNMANGVADDLTTAATTTYRIIRVPRASPRLADLVTKSRATRLHILKTDPTALLAQHAVEEALPLEVWHKRFTHPEITVLVCVATPSTTTDVSAPLGSTNIASNTGIPDHETTTLLLEREWVAVAALRGPVTYEDYYVTPDMGLPVPVDPETEARWHVFDLYTAPPHRGKGLARKLVTACIATAVARTQHPDATQPLRKARIRLFMNPANAWLIRVYESMGFKAEGKVTLEEGFRVNCLDESIPAGTSETEEGRARWHTRFGLAMERVVQVEHTQAL
ncbi:hypothetical protein E8E12_009371 [Didymella heteroderae]|uniref:N-acetyltransferase domain-containing protein n=1 Tax=Didymella heteroderae TaxID=1769908 RepID=A0A9P4WV65_9PLEO|nr:hypothetical protein E8E12_009371 [Didymella heteroderae]